MLERVRIKQQWNDFPMSKRQSLNRPSASQATAAPIGFIVPSLLRTCMPGIVLEIQQKLDNSNRWLGESLVELIYWVKLMTRYTGRLKKKKKKETVCHSVWFVLLPQSDLFATAWIELPGKYFVRNFVSKVLNLSTVLFLLCKSVRGIGFSALQWRVIIWD